MIVLYVGSALYTLGSLVWSIRVTRRVRALEAAEAERLEAENSTIIRRPRNVA